MKILILGHKGMLGSELLLRLSTAHDVTGRDVDSFDIASDADCRRMMAECEPEVVINAAGYTDVDGCENDREGCFAVNATGVQNIAQACRGQGILICHFSTDYVFDGRKRTPYREDDPPSPLSVYGASKLEGELLLQKYSDNYLLIRTAWLYGRHGHHFVKAILEKASRVKTLEVVEDQIGSPTYARDLAVAVELLIAGRHRGVFHVTNRGRCSWYEYACKILQYAGIGGVTVTPIRTEKLARPAVRPAWSVLDGGKFYDLCGKTLPYWQISLQEYLEEMDTRR